MRNSVSDQRSTSSAKFMNQNIVSMKKLCEGFHKVYDIYNPALKAYLSDEDYVR